MVLVLFAAAASFAAMRARRKLGMAIAAMSKMIATTTSSSMRLKPRESWPLIFRLELRAELYFCLTRINAAPNVSTSSFMTVHCNSLPLLVKKKGRKLSFLPFRNTSQVTGGWLPHQRSYPRRYQSLHRSCCSEPHQIGRSRTHAYQSKLTTAWRSLRKSGTEKLRYPHQWRLLRQPRNRSWFQGPKLDQSRKGSLIRRRKALRHRGWPTVQSQCRTSKNT